MINVAKAVVKAADVPAKPKKKRIRRSPELLLQELAKKAERLESRVYKRNKEAVHHIGAAILKRAKFDFNNFTKEDLDEIVNMTPKGSEVINAIIEKAYHA